MPLVHQRHLGKQWLLACNACKGRPGRVLSKRAQACTAAMADIQSSSPVSVESRPQGSLAQRVEGNCVVCASQIVRICCTPKVDGNMPCSSCLANFSLFERVSHGMCLAKSLGTAFAPRVRLGRLSASRCSFFLQKSVRATITCPLPHAHNPPTSHSALTPALTCPVAYAHATLPPLTLPSHPP